MLTIQETVELEKRKQGIYRIAGDPAFLKQFYWPKGESGKAQFVWLVQQNITPLIELIDRVNGTFHCNHLEEIEKLKNRLELYSPKIRRDIEIEKLYKQGVSKAKIAKSVGMSRPGIAKVLKRLGVADHGS